MFKRDAVDYDPVLQITDASTKFREFALNSLEHTLKQVTLQVSDKNGHCVVIKILIQPNNASGNLKVRVFIKLKQFRILKHSYEIKYPTCSVAFCV